jgi:hypothetical protein
MRIERRQHERYPLVLEIRLPTASGRQEIRLSDLSLGGCFIDTIGQVSVGEEVSLEINLPAVEWVSFRGTVTHVQEGFGFGVRFAPLNAYQEAVVNQVIGSSTATAITTAAAQLNAYAA